MSFSETAWPIKAKFHVESSLEEGKKCKNGLGHMTKAVMPIYMSRVVGKPAFCICENKDADQLRGNREADQRLCFRYIDSTIPLLSKSEISSLYSSSMAVQPGLCQTWSQTRRPFFSERGSYGKTH